jgi:hypothetical protein
MMLFDDPEQAKQLATLRRRIDLLAGTLATVVADLQTVTADLHALEGSPADDAAPKRKPASTTVHVPRTLCLKFDQEFRRANNNEPAQIDWPKDTAIMARLAKTRDPERISELIEAFFASTDSFIRNGTPTIGFFSTQINRLIAHANGQNVSAVSDKTRENIRNGSVAIDMMRSALQRTSHDPGRR